ADRPTRNVSWPSSENDRPACGPRTTVSVIDMAASGGSARYALSYHAGGAGRPPTHPHSPRLAGGYVPVVASRGGRGHDGVVTRPVPNGGPPCTGSSAPPASSSPPSASS